MVNKGESIEDEEEESTRVDEEESTKKPIAWSRRTIMFDLSYWKGINHFLDPIMCEQARRWVLESYDDIDEWKEKHKIYTKGYTSGGQRRRGTITSKKPLRFIPLLRRQQIVFYCDWVRIEDKVNSCVIDPETNLIYANLENPKRILKEEDEPFILTSHEFYYKDLTRSDYWHVFLDAPKKLTRDVDAYEDLLVFKGTTHEGSLDFTLAGEVMDEE
ncbi:hypothetical protein GIB67_020694 [Kingdonia uniflora]|uniref:Uncharacterized protein n=1 Tax=Kingdonia uniflora TaxID=39325 RepID=A0A7J7NKF6_9MAGN|nr:hypothetical protein GIB67_020694 [Kingdonia uniflora]